MKKIGSIILIFAGTAFAAGQAVSPGDWWLFRAACDPRISADGGQVVYVEGWNDRTDDAARSNLWTVSADGKNRRQLTQGRWRDFSPRWSPDASYLAYVSDRTGKAQIRVRRMDSGQEREIPSAHAPETLAWSPDGKMLAFAARVPVAPVLPAWAQPALLPFLQQRAKSRVQVFVVPAEGGVVRQIGTDDLDYSGEPSWMPDGRSILIAGRIGEIYKIPVEGGEARQLTGQFTRTAARQRPIDESPVASPDGSKIAWGAREAVAQSYAIRKLYVMNADGSRVKLLAGALDRDVRRPQWSSDSRTVYFLADDHGATFVYSARNDGSVRQVTRGAQRLDGFSLADNGRAVAVRSTAAAASELIAFAVDLPGEAVRLAAPNEGMLAARETGRAEEIRFPSDGKTIQGWVLKPPGFDAAKKYPLLLDIYDAPRSMCGPDFGLRAQIFAASGYLVLCANARGTPGYGEEFGNLIHSRYPGDDFDDLMRGVDAVIAKGYVDTKRLVVVGGLLAAWAIGHTDRFSAAVAQRPITDWMLNVALSQDGIYRAEAWMGAMPWENPDQYVKHSPIYFAQNFKTPTLVIARERDPESEELYFALQARKVKSALMRLNTEKPSQRILEIESILAWFGANAP